MQAGRAAPRGVPRNPFRRVWNSLPLILGLLLACAGAAPLPAQSWPSRPIRLIVPFPPGGPTDVIARLVSDRMAASLGQSVLVEHRPGGAGGTVGAKAVATADPDGYTLLLANVGTLTIAPAVVSLDYEPTRSFAPVALVVSTAQILTVNPSLPVKSVGELLAYAKQNPGKLSYGSPGPGTQPHLIGELIKTLAGIDILHVPYRGSAPAITDLLAGQVQVYIDTSAVLTPHIEAGKIRPLAVAGETRDARLPDLPTLRESGVAVAASFWSGVVAPAGTPAAIVDRLNAVINEGLRSPDMQAQLARIGAETKPGSPRDFATFFAAETRKWADVAKTARIRLD